MQSRHWKFAKREESSCNSLNEDPFLSNNATLFFFEKTSKQRDESKGGIIGKKEMYVVSLKYNSTLLCSLRRKVALQKSAKSKASL